MFIEGWCLFVFVYFVLFFRREEIRRTLNNYYANSYLKHKPSIMKWVA